MMPAASPLTLNGLLRSSGIDEGEVLVFRHRPAEPRLDAVLDWLAAERRDLFDCYQSTHAPRTEAALARARYVASFIRHRPGMALFVGLYEVASSRSITVEEEFARPLHRELVALGLAGTKASARRAAVTEFEMRASGWHDEWCGRLIVRWPGLERSWYRWADRNVFAVEAITSDSQLVPAIPTWDDLVLSWQELRLLPTAWAAALAQWRGVYLIIDEGDGLGYVGSAAGAENMLGRWRDYARTGHGGNRWLRGREPANFRFSILQRTSPDLPEAEVVALERSWKRRLRTAAPHGLNDN